MIIFKGIHVRIQMTCMLETKWQHIRLCGGVTHGGLQYLRLLVLYIDIKIEIDIDNELELL